MRRILFLTCIGSLALVLTAWGAPKEKKATRAKGKPAAHAVSAGDGAHVAARSAPKRTSQSFSAARSRQPAIASMPRARSRSVARASTPPSSRVEAARAPSTRTAVAARNRAATSRERSLAQANTRRASPAEAARARSTRTATAARNRAAINRERSLARANARQGSRTEAARIRNERVARATGATARRNLAVNRQRNLTLARNVLANRERNVRITNYWRSDRFRHSNYAAFYNYNREWHDRDWWRSNFTSVVFVLGGWWGWHGGYWYPAWGYDPYGWYAYDGPIYTGYADLTPDRVIINVQIALQDQGYYAGSVDGLLGPQTRAALAAFQADNSLAITSAVDEPTLQTLGLA
jgi:Putative peptidoglycan binding domain